MADENNEQTPAEQAQEAAAANPTPETNTDNAAATEGTAAEEKRHDGSDPAPHRGELTDAAAGADTPDATADGKQTAAGTADNDAIITPEQLLSTVEQKPAASVGPVVPGSGRAGRGRGRSGRDRDGRRRREDEDDSIESSVIRIYRCSKVVKGGRTFSFAALVVAGDRAGSIGIGYGKANEVPSAVEKATKEARKSMFKFPMKGSSIPHLVIGKSGSSQVKLIPALPGTGVTAGKTVRPILELAGLTDVLTKAYGSTSPKNLLKATVDALRRLQSREEVEGRRGIELEAGAGELVGAAE